MKYKYITSVPKPLLNDFVNNRVIPLIGAGFSKNADIPEGLSMPDWNEIGKLAANEIDDYKYDNNAIDALSYFEDLYSRSKLVEFLMKELNFGKIQPGTTYEAFCKLFTGIICTTNFDSLLEDTMTLLHRPVSVVVTKDRLTIGSDNESKIIKLHGDFNHPDKMVITEHDYDVYIDQNPVFATYIANLFITNTMLLIGYSFDDNDFRSIWQIVNSRLGCMTQPAYCITVGASSEKIARYKRRNIKVINFRGSPQEYKSILHDFFEELKDYIDNKKDQTAKSIDEKINEQMIIPAEENKLCFISCSMTRIAQLSALINPILNNLGITSVRIDDMLMPDDNWIDISSTAIRKSKAAIVDISDGSANVMLELGLIKSIKSEKNVLIICEKGTDLPFSLIDCSVLTYSFDAQCEDDEHRFYDNLKKWCYNVFNLDEVVNNSRDIFIDAYRLFEKCEYSACIVSAYSELEHLIFSRQADLCTHGYKRNFFTLSQFFKINFESYYSIFKEINILRNRIVHKGYKAKKKETEYFLNNIKKIYKVVCEK